MVPPKPATFKLAGSLSTATASDKPKFSFGAPTPAGAAEHAAEFAAPPKVAVKEEAKVPMFAVATTGTFGGKAITTQ